MTPGLEADFRGSGLVHLLALSGLHVVWLAAVARGAVAARRGVPRARALAGAACALALRAARGPAAFAAARVRRRVRGRGRAALRSRALDPVQSLALSAFALLAWRPGWADDLGFQLSCAATLGLVTLSEPLVAPLARRPRARGWRPRSRPRWRRS